MILVRISAFGQTGPSRQKPGFGRIAAAVGGISYLLGYPDRAPVSPGTPTIPDYLAGVMGALNVISVVLAFRLILLVAVCGAIALAYLSLTQPDPYRLGALGIYSVVIVVPMIWLSSRH